jgi:hypothetical protein
MKLRTLGLVPVESRHSTSDPVSMISTVARVRAPISPCEICGGQSGTGTGFSPSYLVFPSISFHPGSPYSYITWGMNNKLVVGSSSETQSHPINSSLQRLHTPDLSLRQSSLFVILFVYVLRPFYSLLYIPSNFFENYRPQVSH